MKKKHYLRLRDFYRPENIRTVFILESPPASGKYFYDPDGSVTEPLFSAMMELLDFKPETKQNGLEHFSKTGHFLVDATYNPVNDIKNPRIRNETILKDFDDLVKDLKFLGNSMSINFILVKANICRLLEQKLVSNGFNVINKGIVIPFPSSGQQGRFRELIPEVYK